MAAIKMTRNSEGSARISISARLYQPEKKLATIAITKRQDKGSPTYNCLNTFFFDSRLASQYSTNRCSCSVSIAAKIRHSRQGIVGAAIQIIYIVL